MATTLPPGVTMDFINQQAAATGKTPDEVIAGMNAAMTGGASTEPMVYLGKPQQKTVLLPQGSHGVKPGKAVDASVPSGEMPASVVAASFLTWSDKQINQAIAKMQGAGLNVNNAQDAYSVWTKLVDQASQTWIAAQAGYPGAVARTPWQMLNLLSGGAGGAGGGPTTYNSSSTTNYSKTDMEAMGNNVYQGELGRDIRPKELDQAPSSTTSSSSRTVTPGQGTSTSANTTNRGENVQQQLVDQARGSKDWAEYQTATKYMDALVGSLRAQV